MKLSEKKLINEFKRQHPEYASKNLAVNQKGHICTAGGKTVGVKDGDTWHVVSVGGRPTADPLSHDLRVRVSDSQYEKLVEYAVRIGTTKAGAVRKLIDEL